jgi:DNA-directed RNA polymerase subunit H (RpoH/RPB5)
LGLADFRLSHFLVPKHDVLAKSRREELLSSLGVDENKLPKIKITDPQVKLLDAKVGDIIKITRKDPTRENTYYRLVVK